MGYEAEIPASAATESGTNTPGWMLIRGGPNLR